MTKQKLFKYLAIGFGVVNVLLVAALIIGKPPSHNNGLHIHKIIEKLQLDEVQQRQFRLLIDHHKEGIRAIDSSMLSIREQLYLPGISSTKSDSLQTLLGNEKAQIENLHLVHFSDIKGILRDDQLPAYGDLMKEIPKMFFKKLPPKKKN